MKKIGFVDYYLSEWHANKYPAWIEEASAELGLDLKLAYCWAELDVSPLDNVTTDEWCEKYGAEKCETLEELCEKSDYIVVLAPKDPEKHLGYAETVLKYGKRTYIDKTFAPDLETAKKIFALGEKYGADFFSTSALRYSEELGEVESPTNIMVMGSGSNFEEYFIHLAEMVVKKLGVGVKSVSAMPNGPQWIVTADYEDGRRAVMIYGRGISYGVYMAKDDISVFKPVKSDFFSYLIRDMLNFFDSGKKSFSGSETLEVMKLRDLAIKATKNPGAVIE